MQDLTILDPNIGFCANVEPYGQFLRSRIVRVGQHMRKSSCFSFVTASSMCMCIYIHITGLRTRPPPWDFSIKIFPRGQSPPWTPPISINGAPKIKIGALGPPFFFVGGPWAPDFFGGAWTPDQKKKFAAGDANSFPGSIHMALGPPNEGDLGLQYGWPSGPFWGALGPQWKGGPGRPRK